MCEQPESTPTFLDRAILLASIVGGGVAGYVGTALALKFLGPVVIVAGAIAGGAIVYDRLTSTEQDPWEPEE